MNCRRPVGNSTRRLTSSHRSASRATWATGWCCNPSPRRRRSTTSKAPPIKANPEDQCQAAHHSGTSRRDRILVPYGQPAIHSVVKDPHVHTGQHQRHHLGPKEDILISEQRRSIEEKRAGNDHE